VLRTSRSRRPDKTAAIPDCRITSAIEAFRWQTTSAVYFGHLEADLDVALGAEIVDFIGAKVVEQPGERPSVGKSAVVEMKARARSWKSS